MTLITHSSEQKQWEIKNKLNPNNAGDATTINASGYSNIEVYLNSVVDIKNVKPATPGKK